MVEAVAEVLAQADGREVLAAGIDHQGESVLAWDAAAAAPLTPVIVWQDKRQRGAARGARARARRASARGCRCDPYFSAGKLAWLLQHDARRAGARASAARCAWARSTRSCCERLGGRLRDRPLDRLAHAAARARRARLGRASCCAAFGLERELLAAIGADFGELGELRHERWPVALPLRAQLVDQQAALAGSGAVRAGRAEGDLRHRRVRARAHRTLRPRARGLLPTVAWAAPAPGAARVATRSTAACSRRARCSSGSRGGLGLAADTPALAGGGREREPTARACVCCRRWPGSARRGGARRRTA